MIREFFEIPIIDKLNKLMDSYKNKEKKKSEYIVSPHDASFRRSARLLANFNT